MSTSIMYRAFGLTGIKDRSTRSIGDLVIYDTDKAVLPPECQG